MFKPTFHKHSLPLFTLALPLLAGLALGVGCVEPEPDQELYACGLGEATVRACQGSTDLSANAKLGTITGDAGSGYTFELAADAGGDWIGDPRYGAVYVLNESDIPMRVRLTRLRENASGSWESEGYSVNRDTEICAGEGDNYCDRRWLDLATETTGVRVEFRPAEDDAAPWVDAGEYALLEDSGDRVDIAANVVELNCSGVRDFWGNGAEGDDYEGNPRHFVSVLPEDGGTRTIHVRNVSDPSSGPGPTWCVFTGQAEDWSPNAGCPPDEIAWSWTDSALRVASPGSSSTLPTEADVSLGAADIALAFTEYNSARDSCPRPSEVSVADRNMVQVVDTTASFAHIYEMSDCEGEHVPVAAPFVVSHDSANTITVFNCSDNSVELCNSSYGACDPIDNPEYTIPVDGSADISFNGTCAHDLTWDENGDPTLIVRKKVDDCMD